MQQMLKRQKTKDEIITLPSTHLISVASLTTFDLNGLMNEAENMRHLVRTKGGDDRLKFKILASIFYEPSTRTSCSFNAAMQRLGGSVISISPQSSSIQKGETIEDTIQTLCCYCDGVVMRHPTKGSLEIASKVCSKPLISAGDGIGEHPTQGLLDLYTIKSELGSIGHEDSPSKMNITVVGDLKHGRTVHSLVRLLKLYRGIKIVYVSPESLSIPAEIMEELSAAGIEQSVVSCLETAIVDADVLYMTRIQKERFSNEEEYAKVSGVYRLNPETMTKAKANMIVMHPLPRVDEISVDVDKDPRAAYIRQMENGMYMRMAILDALMNT